MELECQATIEQEDEEYAWVHWRLSRPGGEEPVAEGRVRYDLETVQFRWNEGRPHAEQMFLVRATVDRAVRGRERAGGNS
jgi:hypothetical protein